MWTYFFAVNNLKYNTQTKYNTNKKNDAGRDALSIAVAIGLTTMAEFLLQLPHTDVNSCDNLGLTALHHAVYLKGPVQH